MKSIHRFTTRIGMMFLVFVVAAVTAHSKPGGHRTAISECRATFQFAPTYAKVVGAEPLQLYLGTTGYASFDGVPIYGPYDVREALSSRAVSRSVPNGFSMTSRTKPGCCWRWCSFAAPSCAVIVLNSSGGVAR